MEQVLNRVDRNQAFIKFLIFFLVTIVLVVGAIFVNYRLPSKENSKLREMSEVQRQSDEEELKFIALMKEAVALQDSIKEGVVQSGAIKTQLDNKLSSLYQIAKTDNTIYGQLNKVIADKLQKLEDQRMRIADINKNSEARYSSMQAELQKCQTNLNDARQVAKP